MDIVIKTLGCKANRYESDRIKDIFGSHHRITDPQIEKSNHADIVIVNTCTVTHVADRKSRQAISHLKNEHPNAKIIVFGCSARTNQDEYKQLSDVDYVVQKRKELDDLIKQLENFFSGSYSKSSANDILRKNRTRALIKIQDGCNNFCSYCIIPYARGREKSRPSHEIINEIKKKIDDGYHEFVLTGINIGMWKENGKDLSDLIKIILDKTKVERLRLSSIEPQNFSDSFTKLFKNSRFCPHLHISLQSGSDEILRAMRRRYDTKFFKKMVDDLRKAVPFISITTDIIVGFPGETEKLFKETLEFVKKTQFSKIHIFPYSKRKGTLAADMPSQVPYSVKKDRCKKLAKTEKEMRLKFYKDNIGRTEKVLIETINNNGEGIGLTSNYLKTRISGPLDSSLKNTIQNVVLEDVDVSGFELIAKIPF